MVDTFLKEKKITYKLEANPDDISLEVAVSVVNDLIKQMNTNGTIKMKLELEDYGDYCELILSWEVVE